MASVVSAAAFIQEIVDDALVLPSDVAQLARQRVDDVKVRDGQQLRFALGQPSARRCGLALRALALRAMPIPARVEGDVRMAARRVLTACDVAAERRRAAAPLDCAHHLQLVEAHMTAVGLAPGGTMLAENVRAFQNRPNHGRRRYRAGSFSRFSVPPACGARRDQARELALDLGDQSRRHAGVARRRVQLLVSEQRLDQPNILAVLEQTYCGHSRERPWTPQFDPLLPLNIGPMNGREARESGLRLKA